MKNPRFLPSASDVSPKMHWKISFWTLSVSWNSSIIANLNRLRMMSRSLSPRPCSLRRFLRSRRRSSKVMKFSRLFAFSISIPANFLAHPWTLCLYATSVSLSSFSVADASDAGESPPSPFVAGPGSESLYGSPWRIFSWSAAIASSSGGYPRIRISSSAILFSFSSRSLSLPKDSVMPSFQTIAPSLSLPMTARVSLLMV